MRALKIIFFIVGGVLSLFGILFILGAGAGVRNGVTTGIVLFVIAFAFILVATLLKGPQTNTTNVTLNVDLPGNVNMDTLKCKSCGGTLAPKDITMVAGAPVVTCPWCHTTYQLTEEPKW
jgi:hypothetical protein